MNRMASIMAVVMLALFTGCQSIPQGAALGSMPTPAQVQHAMTAYRQAHEARCEVCGKPAAPDRVLEVHHIHPRSAFPELAADPANFLLCCRPCHQWVCHPGDFGKYTDDLRAWLKARKIRENRP